MKSLNVSSNTFFTIVRYIARLFSILLITLIIMLSIGEGLPNPSTLSITELLLFASLLIMLVGLVMSWKRENIGGALTILGFVLFFIVNYASSGNIRLGFFFLLFPLTGILFLLCSWMKQRNLSVSE